VPDGWDVARIDDLDEVPVLQGELMWRPVRRRFGIEAFGVNVFSAAAEGDLVIEDHYERDGPEELYVVLRGRATFVLGEQDEEVDAPAGTLVFVRPGTHRVAHAREAGTAVLGVGAKPGEVFEPSGWEWGAIAFAHLDAGRADEARRVMDEGVARDPDNWGSQYNLACFEARTGNTDEAFAALRRAVELQPERIRQFAPGDEDFASIRDDPRFQEVLSG
jgi:mannose-6-phosphate isomerase-like protein (cupin superfamily)